MEYYLHHTAMARGYVSRKNPDGTKSTYKGRFGTGYVVDKPCWHTTNYHIREYWIIKK